MYSKIEVKRKEIKHKHLLNSHNEIPGFFLDIHLSCNKKKSSQPATRVQNLCLYKQKK